MALRQMQINTGTHEKTRNNEARCHGLVQEDYRSQSSDERRKGKVRARTRAAKMTQSQDKENQTDAVAQKRQRASWGWTF